MIFELSRDYKRAFELIKKGDRIACLLDYEGCRDVAIAKCNITNDLILGARGISYIHFFDDQVVTSELFLNHCDRLNVEFYLPLPDDTIVISPKDFKAIATKVIQEKVGKPLGKLIETMEAIA